MSEKTDTAPTNDYKWLEYLLYLAVIAMVLVAVYQLVSTHRIVLLQRETVTSTQPTDTVDQQSETETTSDAGA